MTLLQADIDPDVLTLGILKRIIDRFFEDQVKVFTLVHLEMLVLYT